MGGRRLLLQCVRCARERQGDVSQELRAEDILSPHRHAAERRPPVLSEPVAAAALLRGECEQGGDRDVPHRGRHGQRQQPLRARHDAGRRTVHTDVLRLALYLCACGDRGQPYVHTHKRRCAEVSPHGGRREQPRLRRLEGTGGRGRECARRRDVHRRQPHDTAVCQGQLQPALRLRHRRQATRRDCAAHVRHHIRERRTRTERTLLLVHVVHHAGRHLQLRYGYSEEHAAVYAEALVPHTGLRYGDALLHLEGRHTRSALHHA